MVLQCHRLAEDVVGEGVLVVTIAVLTIKPEAAITVRAAPCTHIHSLVSSMPIDSQAGTRRRESSTNSMLLPSSSSSSSSMVVVVVLRMVTRSRMR